MIDGLMNLKPSLVRVVEKKAVGCPDLSIELVVLTLPVAQQVWENQVSGEVLPCYDWYDMCRYGKYIQLGFEIILNSIATSRDMQISDDDSFTLRFEARQIF